MNLAGVLATFPALRRAGQRTAERREASPPVAFASVDLRAATAQQIAALSLELHLAGELSFEDSAWLGRPPELHAAYRRTVARLIDEPGKSQNHLALWEARLAFGERYCGEERAALDRLRRIVLALRRFDRRSRRPPASASRPAA